MSKQIQIDPGTADIARRKQENREEQDSKLIVVAIATLISFVSACVTSSFFIDLSHPRVLLGGALGATITGCKIVCGLTLATIFFFRHRCLDKLQQRGISPRHAQVTLVCAMGFLSVITAAVATVSCFTSKAFYENLQVNASLPKQEAMHALLVAEKRIATLVEQRNQLVDKSVALQARFDAADDVASKKQLQSDVLVILGQTADVGEIDGQWGRRSTARFSEAIAHLKREHREAVDALTDKAEGLQVAASDLSISEAGRHRVGYDSLGEYQSIALWSLAALLEVVEIALYFITQSFTNQRDVVRRMKSVSEFDRQAYEAQNLLANTHRAALPQLTSGNDLDDLAELVRPSKSEDWLNNRNSHTNV